MKTYIYVLDNLREVSLDPRLVLESRNPLDLFKQIENYVLEEVENIENVEVTNYYRSSKGDVLIEYIVEFDKGRISVKLIVSSNPVETLIDFYKEEEQKHVKQRS